MIDAHNLSPQESSKEKCKKVETSGQQTKQFITKSMEYNNTDDTYFIVYGQVIVSMQKSA